MSIVFLHPPLQRNTLQYTPVLRKGVHNAARCKVPIPDSVPLMISTTLSPMMFFFFFIPSSASFILLFCCKIHHQFSFPFLHLIPPIDWVFCVRLKSSQPHFFFYLLLLPGTLHATNRLSRPPMVTRLPRFTASGLNLFLPSLFKALGRSQGCRCRKTGGLRAVSDWPNKRESHLNMSCPPPSPLFSYTSLTVHFRVPTPGPHSP